MASTRVQDRNWEALKPAQQRRYLNAGVSREAYLSGASLKAARGHAKRERPLKNLGPGRVASGKGEPPSMRQLDRQRVWQQKKAAGWLRNPVFSQDTAAQLSTINLTPRNWESVTIYPRRDGTYDVYVESRRGGPTRTAHLTDLDMVRELQDAIAFKNAGQFDDVDQWGGDFEIDEPDFYETDETR